MNMVNKKREIILSMIKENTGSHFLDSGGESNRAWQRNATKEFSFDDELIEINQDEHGIDATIKVHIFLDRVLRRSDHCELIEMRIQEYNSCNDESISWPGEVVDALEDIYADSEFKSDKLWNSCNYDNALSQDVLARQFTIDDQIFIAVSTHNGADVRGGYSDARIFQYQDGDETLILYFEAHDLHSSDGEDISIYDTNNEEFNVQGSCIIRKSDGKEFFIDNSLQYQ